MNAHENLEAKRWKSSLESRRFANGVASNSLYVTFLAVWILVFSLSHPGSEVESKAFLLHRTKLRFRLGFALASRDLLAYLECALLFYQYLNKSAFRPFCGEKYGA